MIKFNDYNPISTKTIINAHFNDPNHCPEIVNKYLNIVRNGEYAYVDHVDINQYWELIRDPKPLVDQMVFDHDQLLDVPVFYIDKGIMLNADQGCFGFMNGAKTIPVIIVRKATEKETRTILQYPTNWVVEDGCVFVNSDQCKQCIARLSSVELISQAQKIIDKLISNSQLTESVHVGNIINRFRDFSNQSFAIGKVTRDDSTNSYQLMLDKDNSIGVQLIPMLSSADENCLSLFVNGTYTIKTSIITMFNYRLLADCFANAITFQQYCNQLQTTNFDTIDVYPSMYAIDNSQSFVDQYSRQCFIQAVQTIYRDLVITDNQAITSGTIDRGPIKYCFSINNNTNEISFTATLVNYYVGDIIVTDKNQNKLIANFGKLVQQVNSDPNSSVVSLVRQLLIDG